MRVAFVLGRPLPILNAETVPLSSQDLSAYRLFGHAASRHEVMALVPGAPAGSRVVVDWPRDPASLGEFDVVLSWAGPDAMDGLRASVRVSVGDEVSPYSDFCLSHRAGVPGTVFVPPGCLPARHAEVRERHGLGKVPGRVLWSSGAGAGLHLLLRAWPWVVAAVPGASLHVVGDVIGWLRAALSGPDGDLRRMALEVDDLASSYQSRPALGFRFCGPVPHCNVDAEMAEAEVLVGPLVPGPGPSLSVLEACAFEACPIHLDLGVGSDLFRGSLPLLRSVSDLPELLLLCLRDPGFREFANRRASALAASLPWASAASAVFELAFSRLGWRRFGVTGSRFPL